ncbi:(2Fe-2S)-binding protein [Streptomyces sp. SID13726]|uniref:(2Fe-2S)-binding protein n=1 Tax=Streptomyces sp. SID13726 TaxID=2706058 RepID=UPI0013B8D579|nr:(2Fe-2S)-binding protein [Streptomyces sp. SID13726]NEB03573.1 (2Fe-2S)-binding protein [Streptomyces sp. SID13726]
MSLALKTSPDSAVSRALGDVYRRLGDTCEALTVRVEETPGPGMTAARLTADADALHAFVAAESERIHDRYGVRVRPDVAASRALHDYAWTVGVLMGGAWYLDRRVPRIRPEDLRIDLASGTYAITPGTELACLTDDRLALYPGVLTLPQQDQLHARLRMSVADHMRPLLAAIAPVARRRSRALWGMVGDDLVSGIWYLGRMLGQEAAAVRAATEVLPAAVPPYPDGADFRRLVAEDGSRHTTRTRTGCCMFYAIRPAEACVTCPRTADAERLKRLAG